MYIAISLNNIDIPVNLWYTTPEVIKMEENFSKQLHVFQGDTDILEIHCKYARGFDNARLGDEIHEHNEMIFVMSEGVELISEYGQVRIPPYTLMIFPPNTYHKLVFNAAEEPYQRIVLAFLFIPELDALVKKKCTRLILLQNNKIFDLFMQLRLLFDTSYEKVEMDAYIKSIFAQILININTSDALGKSIMKPFVNPIVRDAVEYINANIEKQITVEQIAKHLMISYSCLTKLFKREMNVSVYKFILSKKLVHARKKILSGENPTQVAFDCGFNDYSGFYKQYKKMFGASPSLSKASFRANVIS